MIIKVIYKDGRKAYLGNVMHAEEIPLKTSPDGEEFIGLRVERLIGEKISVMRPLRKDQIESWGVLGEPKDIDQDEQDIINE